MSVILQKIVDTSSIRSLMLAGILVLAWLLPAKVAVFGPVAVKIYR